MVAFFLTRFLFEPCRLLLSYTQPSGLCYIRPVPFLEKCQSHTIGFASKASMSPLLTGTSRCYRTSSMTPRPLGNDVQPPGRASSSVTSTLASERLGGRLNGYHPIYLRIGAFDTTCQSIRCQAFGGLVVPEASALMGRFVKRLFFKIAISVPVLRGWRRFCLSDTIPDRPAVRYVC